MVHYLAHKHKCHDRDSNPHPDDLATKARVRLNRLAMTRHKTKSKLGAFQVTTKEITDKCVRDRYKTCLQ